METRSRDVHAEARKGPHAGSVLWTSKLDTIGSLFEKFLPTMTVSEVNER